jgi:hypothetical protein
MARFPAVRCPGTPLVTILTRGEHDVLAGQNQFHRHLLVLILIA